MTSASSRRRALFPLAATSASCFAGLLMAVAPGCSHNSRRAPAHAHAVGVEARRVTRSSRAAPAKPPSPPAPAPARPSPVPPSARQLLLSVARDWDSPQVALSRYTRSSASAPWRRLGRAWQGVAGRSGLAWGSGLHGKGAPEGEQGPVKKEGDGRAVAGVFRLGPAFGYAARAPAGTHLGYTESTPTWRCVDDPASRHYGQLLDASHVQDDWHSAEHLRLESDAYRLLIVVQHNTAHVPGAGSCIFLHVWKGPEHGTSGCTAMPYPEVERLVRWIEPERAVFVALPQDELETLAARWRLPRG